MKILYILNTLGAALLMSGNGCGTDYVDDKRIVVEGKISSTGQPVSQVPVKLYDEDIVISRTTTASDGTFRLGGPGTLLTKTLFFNRKILNFSTDADSCQISWDSLSISIPKETNYVNFSNIQLQ